MVVRLCISSKCYPFPIFFVQITVVVPHDRAQMTVIGYKYQVGDKKDETVPRSVGLGGSHMPKSRKASGTLYFRNLTTAQPTGLVAFQLR